MNGGSLNEANPLFIILVVVLYFVPSVIAMMRNRAIAAILIVNVLLGWTFIGWFVALVWSATEKTQHEREVSAANAARAAQSPSVGALGILGRRAPPTDRKNG